MPLLRKLSELVFGTQAVNAASAWSKHANPQQYRYEKEKEYIARESSVGARVLGPVPSGHNREFFCLDENTWIWHESWKDEQGQHQEFTVNYEIDPTGILKRVNGGQYTKLLGEELIRFDQATDAYHKEVNRLVYGRQVTPVV